MTSIPTPEATPQQAPDLPALIECALRYWWAGLIAGVVFAGCGLAASQFIPAKYKSTALIRIGGPEGLIDTPHESSSTQREFRHTQKELMKMPHVLRRAIESPEVAALEDFEIGPEAAEEAGELVEVELPRSSSITKVSVSHDNAETAYMLVNAVVKSYLEESQRAETEERERRLDTLDRLHSDAEDRLTKAWEELQTLARQIGSGDPAALSLQAQAEIENYRAYSRRLREIRGEKREAERQIRAIKESPELLAEELPEDASMHSVKFAMFTAKLKKEQALRQWGPDHPDAVAAKEEEDLLREYYQKATAQDETEPRSRQEELLSEPLATIDRLQQEELSLEAMIGDIEDRLELLGGDNAARLEILRNEVTRMERLSDRLWQTRENLQVEKHADQRVQLVSLGTLPTKRDTSKQKKLGIVLAGGGFGFAFVLVALGEFLTGRLHTRRDAQARTALSLIGERRPLPSEVRSTPLTSKTHVATSELDMMVAQLLTSPQTRDAKTFMVTNAKNRSERGHIAAHLAATLARTGQKTVLVELDFRTELADDEQCDASTTSLADYLVAPNHQESPVKVQAGYGCMHVARAGHTNPEPLPLLTGSRLNSLLEELQHDYSYVVLDVASVLEYPDALHVGRFADAVLLAIQQNTSRAGDLVQAKSRLASLEIPMFGIFTR